MSSTALTIQDLQSRVSAMENTISSLVTEVDRLSGFTTVTSLKTSIPLAPIQTGRIPYRNVIQRPNQGFRTGRTDEPAPTPVNLSEILNTGEDVTFTINTGRDANGDFQKTTAITNFNGTDLTVKECKDVPSLVGLKSVKPGEILFKFMFALKETGVISRTFNALPWRLCSVQRDGQTQTLSQLRKAKFNTEDS